MCGIVGIYNFGNNKPVDKDILRKMCEVIKHRGPDDEGYYLGPQSSAHSPQTGLGIRRLAIIDLETGHQPIHNEEETIWIVLNGEIYNFLDLRKDLEIKGHRFYTKTDTETIVHLYEEYGYDCLKYLRGMFAFALWDSQRKQLFLARDRLGKKPLYYFEKNGSLYFASEIKALREVPILDQEIELEAIDLFLTYQYIPSPLTIYKNVRRLPPASYLISGKNGIERISCYWELNFRQKKIITFPEACQEIRNILTQATKLRMIADVPLGAFLSGGHDSSIIVGLMAENSTKPIKTFSIGFREENFSELKYARIVARHFSTEHTELIVEPKMAEILPQLIWYYDQPFADASMIPSYYVAQATRKYVTVALNGDGGDENFCGYLRYQAIKLASILPFEIIKPEFYQKLVKLFPLIDTTSGIHKLRYFRRFLGALGESTPVRNILWHCFFTNELKNFIYSDFMKQKLKKNAYDYLLNTYHLAKANNPIDKISYTDIITYLPEDLLVKMDIASMANSLEARSPFLDHKLLEFTASIPANWKLHNWTTKYLLKKTFENFLPKEIIHRGKQGFGIPVGKWLRNELKDYVKQILISERLSNRPYFNFENIKILLENHFSGKEDHGYRIFALLVLELWHRIFIY
jgi:asparagine synthase (glutamine-hydrolysing)